MIYKPCSTIRKAKNQRQRSTGPSFNDMNLLENAPIFIGDNNSKVRVYMGNRPSYCFSGINSGYTPLQQGNIHDIGQKCGNGWRKVFNVYAKIMFALPKSISPIKSDYNCWQDYREAELLQKDSNTALMFDVSGTATIVPQSPNDLIIVMGKTYANKVTTAKHLTWLNDEFAIDPERRLIVTPYFDYRQLSNAKILFLINLLEQQLVWK